MLLHLQMNSNWLPQQDVRLMQPSHVHRPCCWGGNHTAVHCCSSELARPMRSQAHDCASAGIAGDAIAQPGVGAAALSARAAGVDAAHATPCRTMPAWHQRRCQNIAAFAARLSESGQCQGVPLTVAVKDRDRNDAATGRSDHCEDCNENTLMAAPI
jgi:hypothetical protein